jgi:hypothetical protein
VKKEKRLMPRVSRVSKCVASISGKAGRPLEEPCSGMSNALTTVASGGDKGRSDGDDQGKDKKSADHGDRFERQTG